MWLPTTLVLIFSVIRFSNANCCEQKARVSSFLSTALDLLSKAKAINITCPEEKDFADLRPLDCSDLYRKGYNKSGVYTIYPINRLSSMKRLEVYCDMNNGGWTVIQRRGDYGRHKEYFNQDWAGYKKGFGSLEMDFWLGNDNIFAITNQRPYAVYFALEDKQKNKAYAQYDNFYIDDEFNKYTLHLNGYSGTAGDAMKVHNNRKFTTKDQDNEPAQNNCGEKDKSGWWFNNCYTANLNGMYYNETRGINWRTWKNKDEYLPRVEIKIKPSIV